MSNKTTVEELLEKSRRILEDNWKAVLGLSERNELKDFVHDSELKSKIRRLVNSKTKSYRYVLPTQLAAKLAEPVLDCRTIQAGSGKRGAFDARSIAHKVIVPFDQANNKVLGGSMEPYVNNPLRVPEISKKYRNAQKNKEDWDLLCDVLGRVESGQDANSTMAAFRQVLKEIYNRLGQASVSYPVPRRISVPRSLELIDDFLKE